MSLELSGATLLSMIAGILIGLLDSAGFFVTVKFFVKNSHKTARMTMVGLELVRLALLLFVMVYLIREVHLQTLMLISTALLVSLSGKVIFALNGKLSHVKR